MRERVGFTAGLLVWVAWIVHGIGGGVFGGEAIYLRSGLSMMYGDVYQNPTHMHAPIVKYVIGVAQVALGVTPSSGRLVSIAFGVGTLISLWYLGKLVASERAGLLAAATLALTYEFVILTPTVLLETGMTFFLVLSLIALVRWWNGSLRPAAFGAVVLCLGATKVQAGILVLAVLAVAATRRPGRSEITRFLAGAAATGLVVYLPYMLVPAPDYYGGASIPPVAETLLGAPVLGGVAYVWAAMLFTNLVHVSSGHDVLFLGRMMERAPFWAYPVWMVTRGGVIHILGLGAAAVIARSERTSLSRVSWVLLCAFLFLTVIPVRLPRYAVVLYPMTSLVVAAVVDRRIRGAERSLVIPDRMVPAPLRDRSVPVTVSSQLAVLGVVLLLLPAALSIPGNPSPDTGYDEAARYVEKNSSNCADVVAENPAALSWHLGFTSMENYSYDVREEHTYALRSGEAVRLSKGGEGCIEVGHGCAATSDARRVPHRKHHTTESEDYLCIRSNSTASS